MKLSMLSIVNRTDDALRRTQESIAQVEADGFVITIGGERQDDAMLARVKPVLLSELAGRKASLERDLASYGVVLG